MTVYSKNYSIVGLSDTNLNAENFSYLDIYACRSLQQLDRAKWKPEYPVILDGSTTVQESSKYLYDIKDADIIAKLFPKTWGKKLVYFLPSDSQKIFKPLRIGIVLSGGQAPGGHCVFAGVYDFIKKQHPQSQLVGFKNGPIGIYTHSYVEITGSMIDNFRNMGGFDIVTSGRHKIETEEQLEKSLEICLKLDLDGLIIVGGDDSNTNAAMLSEYFEQKNCKTKISGVPKTIDGDLKNEYIEIPFGYDTATKLYSECIGNLATECRASNDKYHFVRLMGRTASNITFECGLQTRANLIFISEEVSDKKRSLISLVEEIVDMIQNRAMNNKFYGIILIPEGIVEFVPEIKILISEINDMLGINEKFDRNELSPNAKKTFDSLPVDIRENFLLERDAHGNVHVSKIPTEELFISMTRKMLTDKKFGYSINFEKHFFGYEGRSALPSNFDTNYAYSLGQVAALLISQNLTGYMSTISNLSENPQKWTISGCPLTMMMNIEKRKSKEVPVIKKYFVNLNSKVFKFYEKVREDWKYMDLYRNPGPIQFCSYNADKLTFMLVPPPFSYFMPSNLKDSFDNYSDLEILSDVQIQRLKYRPSINTILLSRKLNISKIKKCYLKDQQTELLIKRSFPFQTLNHGNQALSIEYSSYDDENYSEVFVGVLLVGNLVPGLMNVLQGIIERLEVIQGSAIGFNSVKNLSEGKYVNIRKKDISKYLNQAGFDVLKKPYLKEQSIRDKNIRKKIADVCSDLKLTGLILIGGHSTIYEATLLTEEFLMHDVSTSVVGIPASQEHNLKHALLEIPLGFDSVSKLYSTLIGNLLTDANSAKKYWYFIRIMGDGASNMALECSLQTHINCILIPEAYEAKNIKLEDIVKDICDKISERSRNGQNYGAILIPDNLLYVFIEMTGLFTEINRLLDEDSLNPVDIEDIKTFIINLNEENVIKYNIRPWITALLHSLPIFFRKAISKVITSEGMNLTAIPIESILAEWIRKELDLRKKQNNYSGNFDPITYCLGYQGKGALPSNFDCALGLSYGYLSVILTENNLTGYLCSIRNLCSTPNNWKPSAIPFTSLYKIVTNQNSYPFKSMKKPISASGIDLKSKIYECFSMGVENWEMNNNYCNPGPIQFSGPCSNIYNRTLYEEQHDYIIMISELEKKIEYIRNVCSFGVNSETLKTSVVLLDALCNLIKTSI